MNGTDWGHNAQAGVPPCFGSHHSTVTDSSVKVPALPTGGPEARPQPPTRRAKRVKLPPQIREAPSPSHGRQQAVTRAGTQNGSLVPYVNTQRSAGWTGKGHGPAFSRVTRAVVRPRDGANPLFLLFPLLLLLLRASRDPLASIHSPAARPFARRAGKVLVRRQQRRPCRALGPLPPHRHFGDEKSTTQERDAAGPAGGVGRTVASWLCTCAL